MIEMKVLALIVAAALNPLVARTPEPHGVVPAECEVSDRPPMTRVAEAEPVPEEVMPLPAVRPAATPAAKKNTNELQDVQRALAKNDRAAFDAALAHARAQGAATRVYDDIARLWDAQFESPFFAEGSEPHRIAGSYPGYEAAVRRQVFTDARGRKFYPAAESRAFVASSVGVSSPPRATTTTQTTRRASSTETTPPSRRKQPSLSTSRKSTSTPKKTTSQPRTSSPVARRSPAPQEARPIPSAPPQTAAATEPAPVVPPAVETSSTVAPPAAGSTTTETIPTDTGAPATETTAPTTAAAPPAGPATTPAAPSKTRSIILPAILILIGLGVLILLFRTAK